MILKYKFSKLSISVIFISIGVYLLGLTYYIAYEGTFYDSLFWMSILLISITVFLMILDKDISERYKIILLFFFGTLLYLMNILPSTIHFHFPDELATFETTRLIYDNGNIDVTPHFEISKYYPGLEFLTIFFGALTNLDIFASAKILIGMIHSFILIFIYIFLKYVSSSDRVAAIATFIYATNPMYIFFHSLFSYESLGIFFGVLIIFIISKISFKGKSISCSILIIIVLSAIVITHHLSSLMVLLFVVFLAVIINYKNIHTMVYKKFYTSIVFLVAMFILFWMIYVAIASINYLFGNFISRFNNIFELSLLGGGENSKNTISSSLDIALLSDYEYIIATYIYTPLLLLLSTVGAFFVSKNAYTYTMLLYGPILYLLSIGFVLTSGQELAIRTWGFLYIGISLMVAVGLDRLLTIADYRRYLQAKLIKIFSISAAILILIGGVSIGDKPIHRVPDLLLPKLVAASGSMTTDVFYAADWFKYHYGKYNRMMGDRATSLIFDRYGDQDVDSYKVWRVFFPETVNENVTHFIKGYAKIKYIIVDKRIAQFPAEYGTYFSKDELKYPYRSYGYGRIRPLSNRSIEKFDYSNIFYKTYDNGNIGIYNIHRDKL